MSRLHAVGGDRAFSVAAFGAGRILGLDAFVENYEGGEPLVEKYPVLDCVLG